MDELIRGARGSSSIDGAVKAADFDSALRLAAGRGPAASVREGNDAASEDQLRSARLAGLPDALADRLQGDDLGADARALASAYVAAGGALVPDVSFDGGARGGGQATAPPMDEQLRRARDNRRLFGGSIPLDQDLSHQYIDR